MKLGTAARPLGTAVSCISAGCVTSRCVVGVELDVADGGALALLQLGRAAAAAAEPALDLAGARVLLPRLVPVVERVELRLVPGPSASGCPLPKVIRYVLMLYKLYSAQLRVSKKGGQGA